MFYLSRIDMGTLRRYSSGCTVEESRDEVRNAIALILLDGKTSLVATDGFRHYLNL